MRHEILTMHEQTQGILKIKGIEYSSLRRALTPRADRFEYAFIFDSTRIAPGAYGLEVAGEILSSIDRQHNCSILSGDLIHDDQGAAFELLNRHVILHKSCEIQNTMQLFCVYINNLSRAMHKRIHQRLLTYEPYIGRVETTYSSAMKTYLSTTIRPTYLKVGHKMICGNDDETSNDVNINTQLWPLEESGYECFSVLSIYFDLFLSYKIERAVYPGFQRDTTYALSAITDLPRPLVDFNVVVTESKMSYFASKKTGILQQAGIEDIAASELEEMIASKIEHNYIYNLIRKEEDGASLFNIMLEIPNPKHATPTRLTLGLKYKPHEGELHAVTLLR